MSSSSSSSSEDEMDILDILPRPRILRDRNNPFEMYDELNFKMRYRLSKNTVIILLNGIKESLEYVTNRNFPVSPMNQLLITLRYYATGSFQAVLGDHINVHKSTVCRIIPRVTRQIASLRNQFIKMPETQPQIRETITDFYRIRRFPCVLGAIDCSHIKIQSPGGNNGELFRNRKGWFSINVQAVCNAHLKFMDIIARWAGSVHDSTIFNDSHLKANLEGGLYPNCHLLGDSGYACKSYLLTPLLNPTTPAEQRYNNAHIKTRTTIERTFGVWKRRFPCLAVGMRLEISKVLEIIVATAVLHNIATDLNDERPPNDPGLQLPPEAFDPVPIDHNLPRTNLNVATRTALINGVFTE